MVLCCLFTMNGNGRVYVTGGNYFCFSLTLYPIPSMSKLVNSSQKPAWNIHFVGVSLFQYYGTLHF